MSETLYRVMAALRDPALTLSTVERLVLVAIADHAELRDGARPAVGTLARMAGVEERTVRTAVGSLRDAGWIAIDSTPGKPNTYRVLDPGSTITPDPRSPLIQDPPSPDPRSPLPLIQDPPRLLDRLSGDSDRAPTPPRSKARGDRRRAETPSPARKPSTRRTTCPASTDSDAAAWCAREGLPDLAATPELARMLDHHAAKGSVMARWSAAWATWSRRSVEFARERGRPVERPPPSAPRPRPQIPPCPIVPIPPLPIPKTA